MNNEELIKKNHLLSEKNGKNWKISLSSQNK